MIILNKEWVAKQANPAVSKRSDITNAEQSNLFPLKVSPHERPWEATDRKVSASVADPRHIDRNRCRCSISGTLDE